MWWEEALEHDGIEVLIHEQGGIVSREQLLLGGYTDSMIRRHHRARRWQVVHPGVYANHTGSLDYHGRLLAGLLYAGSQAMWSHYTAAEQLGLIAIDTTRSVHVTVPATRRVQRQPGLVIHRSRQCEHRRHSVVPPRCTEAHAVLDIVSLADSLDGAAGVVLEALQSGNVTAAEVQAAMARRRVPFRRELGSLLRAAAAGAHSLLEVRYLEEVERRHNLPTGSRQRAVEGEFTDVAYERYGVVVELDGRFHLEPAQRRRDMDRDNRAVLRGEATLRYGWHDVTVRPCAVAVQVDALLRQAGSTPTRPCGPACPVPRPWAVWRPRP